MIFQELPADHVRFGLDRVVEIAQQPVDEFRVGILSGRQIGQRDEVAVAQHVVEQLGQRRFLGPFRELRAKCFPAVLGHARQIPTQSHLDIEPFGGHPSGQPGRTSLGQLTQPVGESLACLARHLFLFLAQLGSRHLLLVFDLLHEAVESGLDQRIGQSMQGPHFDRQPLGRVVHVGKLFEQSE